MRTSSSSRTRPYPGKHLQPPAGLLIMRIGTVVIVFPADGTTYDLSASWTVQVCTADNLLCSNKRQIVVAAAGKVTHNLVATAVMLAGGCCDISRLQNGMKGQLLETATYQHIDRFKAAKLLQFVGASTLPPTVRVLELACGVGYVSSLMAPHFPRVLRDVPRYFCAEPDQILSRVGLFGRELAKGEFVHLLAGMDRQLHHNSFFAIPQLLAAMPPDDPWRRGPFNLILSREFFLHLPPGQLFRAMMLLASLLVSSDGRIIAAVNVNDDEWCYPQRSEGEAWERTIHASFTRCAFCMAAASAGFACTWLPELRGMFFRLHGSQAPEEWVLLTTSAGRPENAAMAGPLRPVRNIDISYGEDCCVFRRSADNPLAVPLVAPFSHDGRCWYTRLEHAERVCAMFPSCVGVVHDSNGFEPRRGPAELSRSPPRPKLALWLLGWGSKGRVSLRLVQMGWLCVVSSGRSCRGPEP